jgi:hypothetical protein
MQSNVGFRFSFSGFVDYSDCYPIPHLVWVSIGTVMAIGAAIAPIPQIQRIVIRRTSYGLSSTYVTVTTVGQFILVCNVIWLHAAVFIGILQVPLLGALPRLLTFFITFFL